MARSTVVYPSSNISFLHTGSGYSEISDTRGNYDTTAITHRLSSTGVTRISSSFGCDFKSSDTSKPVGKFVIRSITGGEMYVRLTSSNADSQTGSIVPAVSIEGSAFRNGTAYNTNRSSANYSTQTFTVSGVTGSSQIYSSLSDANIVVQATTAGTFVSASKNSYNATIGISAINLDMTYDNVYDCSTTVIQGYGIASATQSDSEVVEGSSSRFTATLETDCKFLGWYDNPDFTGNPLSTSTSFLFTPTSSIVLYPKGEVPKQIHIFSAADEADKFTYTLSKQKAFAGDSVTLTVTVADPVYRFAGIYEADSGGHRLGFITDSSSYTFTMPSEDVYLYVELGREVKIYVDCLNCTLVGETSPITVPAGKTHTLNFSYNSGSYDWSGIYSDARYQNRLSREQSYTFLVGESDTYLYAKAIAKQQIYVKSGSSWEAYSEVWKKQNGVWVRQEDFTEVFNTSSYYRRVEL